MPIVFAQSVATPSVAPPPPSFLPSDVPGLLAWYTAGVGTYSDAGTTPATNTQTVQQWNDRSVNGYNMKMAASGNRPQYLSTGFNGKPTVKFTQATPTGMLTDPGVAVGNTAATSCFFVGQMLTGTASDGMGMTYCRPGGGGSNVDSSANGSFVTIRRNAANNQVNGFDGTANEYTAVAISLATSYRWAVVVTRPSGDYVEYLNGVSSGTGNTANDIITAGELSIGCRIFEAGFNGTWAWDGPISEAIWYNATVSDPNLALLDTYFQTTWGF